MVAEALLQQLTQPTLKLGHHFFGQVGIPAHKFGQEENGGRYLLFHLSLAQAAVVVVEGGG